MAPVRRLSPGFTLLEVLLALLIITTGFAGFLGVATRINRLGGLGLVQQRIAHAFESRIDWLKAEAWQRRCAPPAPGTAINPDGISEWWSVRPVGRSLEAVLVARGPGSPLRADTVLIRFPCE